MCQELIDGDEHFNKTISNATASFSIVIFSVTVIINVVLTIVYINGFNDEW